MNILFKCLLALVVLAPLPLGAVFMWTWSLMALLVALMLIAWTALMVRSGKGPAVPLTRIWPAATLFGLVIIWAYLQTQNWMPQAWHHPLWQAASEALGIPLKGSISINPFKSHSMILRLLMYAGVFWLSLQLCRDRNRAQTALKVMAIAGAVYAAYGLVVLVSGTNTILWLNKTSYFDVLTSTFVNRNNYAAYAGMGLLAMTALLVQTIEEKLPRGINARDTARHALLLLFQKEWIHLTGWILLLTGVILSQSRAGLMATAIGLIALLMMLAFRRTGRRKLALKVGLGMIATAVFMLVVSGGGVLDRIGQSEGKNTFRSVVYKNTLTAINDSPLLGTGGGSFEDAFRIYKDSTLNLGVARAHNTYLENSLELGIPAALGLFLVILVLAGITALGTRRRERDSIFPCLGVAVTILVGMHSLVDFPLQIAAIVVSYLFLLGLGCAQSWSTKKN